MNRILPSAQQWALYFMIATGISLLGQIFQKNIIGIIISLLLIFFLVKYRSACNIAYHSEDMDDFAQACRWQKNILILQGIIAALLLIFLVFALLGVAAVILLALATDSGTAVNNVP